MEEEITARCHNDFVRAEFLSLKAPHELFYDHAHSHFYGKRVVCLATVSLLIWHLFYDDKRLISYLDDDGQVDEHIFFAEKIESHEELLVVLVVSVCDHLKIEHFRLFFKLFGEMRMRGDWSVA